MRNILRSFFALLWALAVMVWKISKHAWRPSFWQCVHYHYKANRRAK